MYLTAEDKLAEEVNHWFQILGDHDPTRRTIKSHHNIKPAVPPAQFRRITPIDDAFLADDFFIFTDVKPTDLDWPIDVSFVVRHEEDWLKWQVHRYVAVTPRQVRGKVSRVSKFMMRNLVWIAPHDEPACSLETIHAYVGGQWTQADAGLGFRRVGELLNGDHYVPIRQVVPYEEDRKGATVACGLAFNQRYEWGVELSIDETAPSLMLPTDPTGVRELFTSRERNPHKNRRDALLHWVRRHLRKRRKDPDTTNWVRAHLRGQWTFEWHGMTAIIHPSQYDLEVAVGSVNPK